MVDLSYRVEKRLLRSPVRCPECGRRAKFMVEESHMPGRRGVALSSAPHIAREYRCFAGHRWRSSSYDGWTFEPVDSLTAPGAPKTPLQALTEGIPRGFLISGAVVFVGAFIVLVLAIAAMLMLVFG